MSPARPPEGARTAVRRTEVFMNPARQTTEGARTAVRCTEVLS